MNMRAAEYAQWLKKIGTSVNSVKQPLVEVFGDKRVLLENYIHIDAFGPEQVCVKVSFGRIRIDGCRLKLKFISSEQVVVCGQICSINLLPEVSL